MTFLVPGLVPGPTAPTIGDLLVSDERYATSGMRRETLYNPRRPVTMADGGGWYAFRFQVELRMDSTRAV